MIESNGYLVFESITMKFLSILNTTFQMSSVNTMTFKDKYMYIKGLHL